MAVNREPVGNPFCMSMGRRSLKAKSLKRNRSFIRLMKELM
jgi:hypothetical protein